MTRFVITGTDTGVGKTVFAAALVAALQAKYWKPIQAGLESDTDSETVRRLANINEMRIVPEIWRFKAALSPHRAAELENITIDADALTPPVTKEPLLIEGAGGALVPLNRRVLYADVFARWRLPVILVSRTALGTINHTLLSLEAMRRRNIDVLGIAFVGDENIDSEKTICEMGHARELGRLPFLKPLTPQALHAAFTTHFDITDFSAKEAA